MNKFAETLRKLMREHDISQNQLAQILGLKQQTISRYVNGDREPDIDTLLKLAKCFDISTDRLLGLEDI